MADECPEPAARNRYQSKRPGLLRGGVARNVSHTASAPVGGSILLAVITRFPCVKHSKTSSVMKPPEMEICRAPHAPIAGLQRS